MTKSRTLGVPKTNPSLNSSLVAVGLSLLLAGTVQASTISTPVTAIPGFTYTGANANNNMSGSQLAGAFVTATFADLTSETCVFTSSATCVGTKFNLIITPPTSQTNSATWEVFNTDVGVAMSSVLFNIANINPTTQAGQTYSHSVFFPCVDASGNPIAGGCAGGATAHSVSAGGTFTASAEYINAVHPPTPYTYYTELLLTFQPGFIGAAGAAAPEFAFGQSSILFQTLTPDVPEPTTLSMVGLGIAGVIGFRFRRKRLSRK